MNEGIIVPIKAWGFLQAERFTATPRAAEVPELPGASIERSSEDMLCLAFHLIDPELFSAPRWFSGYAVLTSADLHHLDLIVNEYEAEMEEYDEDRLKIGYFQGVLDAESLMQSERSAG